MSLAFRNLTTQPDEPLSSWPTEAVQTALERGGLADWRRLAAEVRADPWGRTARQIEEVLSHSRPYGVAELFGAMIDFARGQAEASERAEVSSELRDLVAHAGLTQASFARRMGTSAPRLSSYVTGSVVPSASLMVRARRIADDCRK